MRSEGIVYLGTSNIVLPGPKMSFPDVFKNSSRLHYYSHLFNSLEINSSFYKIPLAKTFEKWTAEVVNEFRFTVKCWRGITHVPDLNFAKIDIENFMARIERLGSKAGCLLIQFPASIDISYLKKVETILEIVRYQNKNQQWKLAIEVRHKSWYCDTAYKIFEKYNVSVVLHDMPGSRPPGDWPTGDFVYCRFHGPTGNYDGSYSKEFLYSYAEEINEWKKNKKEIYVYFNNTVGSAFENARLLQTLV